MSAREKKMRALVSLVALLGLLSSTANAGPKEDALAVLDKWTKAFAAVQTTERTLSRADHLQRR
jgi:hypothetical protein